MLIQRIYLMHKVKRRYLLVIKWRRCFIYSKRRRKLSANKQRWGGFLIRKLSIIPSWGMQVELSPSCFCTTFDDITFTDLVRQSIVQKWSSLTIRLERLPQLKAKFDLIQHIRGVGGCKRRTWLKAERHSHAWGHHLDGIQLRLAQDVRCRQINCDEHPKEKQIEGHDPEQNKLSTSGWASRAETIHRSFAKQGIIQWRQGRCGFFRCPGQW